MQTGSFAQRISPSALVRPYDAIDPVAPVSMTKGIFIIFYIFFRLSLFLFFKDPAWFYQSPGVVCFSFDSILSPFVVVLIMT